MRNYCAVCFLAVALCLVVCVSASTTVTQAEAEREVEAAKKTATGVRERAENELKKVNGLLKKLQLLQSEAAQAFSQAAKAPKDNQKALEIAEAIESSSGGADGYYSEAKKMLDDAIRSLTPLLEEAKQWEGKSNIEITANKEQEDDYTETKRNATNVKGEAEHLNGRITNALPLFDRVDTAANNMAECVKDAKYESSHLSVVVAVAKIENMIKEADSNVKETQKQRDAVNDVVNEMMPQCKKDLFDSNKLLKKHCQSADDALTSATSAVTQAQQAEADMKQQKGLAEVALTNIQNTDIDLINAEAVANAAKQCVATAEQNVVQLNNALEAAKASVKKANDAKQEIKPDVLKATSEERTKQAKEKEEETNPPVVDGTVPHQKDTTIQPTITAKEQPPSKESPGQDTNIEDKLKDTLINSAQNVPTTSLTGGKAPAPGANNDSAMTVSVPLLVALIASAALQ